MSYCPHCQRNVWTARGERHEAKCVALNHAKYTAMLNRGDGCIMGFNEWCDVAKRAGLLSAQGLMLACNAPSWCDVATYFGLGYKPMQGTQRSATPKATMQRRALRNALDAPLTDAERHACRNRGATEFAGAQGVHSAWRVVDVWR